MKKISTILVLIGFSFQLFASPFWVSPSSGNFLNLVSFQNRTGNDTYEYILLSTSNASIGGVTTGAVNNYGFKFDVTNAKSKALYTNLLIVWNSSRHLSIRTDGILTTNVDGGSFYNVIEIGLGD